ncbi:uncharacterized protein Z519_12642 [Cladophialophora bantiana CBS 173.52]|uniref:Amino acid transporter transmembrane domain-containing protein n=1 Tax=Cladophialophora bantiana (strain ATCC 10958 / CBS 173.52 / CDC B-1940 / NIH 8579) TaxID=1442370 RepID=A0A0D2HQL8_CLAB1|nr:uncharacterized protein Z519_12642 [Cladophialophora bantiana CBS 173.52]KIW86729.1 hypothetical protein Z519_12642 [Cladophialophora bantiana CBS 173.52]
MASRSPPLRASSDPFGPDQEKDIHSLYNLPFDPSAEKRRSTLGSAWRRQSEYQETDPFGDDHEEGAVKYRTLKWWQCSMIMIAETISLGILSLPSVLATIGMVPGAILIVGIGIVATYSGYVIGQFKAAHPWMQAMFFSNRWDRAAAIGREVLGAAQTIFLIFSMASHILTWTICLNTLTDGAACTIVWGIVGFFSITTAVIVTMAGTGARGPSHGHFNTTQSATFATAFLTVTNIVFANAGHVAFFSFNSEMTNPHDFPKAFVLLQVTDTSMSTHQPWDPLGHWSEKSLGAWLFLNYGQYTRNWRKMALTVVNLLVFAMGAGIGGMGLYASGYAISNEPDRCSWTCKTNAQ